MALWKERQWFYVCKEFGRCLNWSCSTGRTQAASWCSSCDPPDSWYLHCLIKISSSARLPLQTGKIFSPPKGRGLQCKSFCCFSNSSVTMFVETRIWKQRLELDHAWLGAIWSPFKPVDLCFDWHPDQVSPHQVCQCPLLLLAQAPLTVPASLAALTAFLASKQSSAHAFHVCPIAPLTSQGLDLSFHGHRDPLFMQRTCPVPCHPKL